MAKNLNDVVNQFVAYGMPPIDASQLRVCGKVCRYGAKKRGWYVLYENQSKSGRFYITGAFGLWGMEREVIAADFTGVDDAERAEMQAKFAAQQRAVELKKQTLADNAANRAGQQWADAGVIPAVSELLSFNKAEFISAAGEYAERKRIKPENARINTDGALLVPCIDYSVKPNILRGVQTIAGNGDKRFNAGMQKAGTACLLGDISKTDVSPIILCEGYATGCTIRLLLGFAVPVFVCFDAGNLEAVAKMVRAKLPTHSIFIAADDDFQTEIMGKKTNVGVIKATAAATAVGGTVIVPFFDARAERGNGTDFNDLRDSHGIACAMLQLTTALQQTALIETKASSPAPALGLESVPVADVPALDFDAKLAAALRDFALIEGSTNVFSVRSHSVVKRAAFKLLVTAEVCKAWDSSEKRRTIEQFAVKNILDNNNAAKNMGVGGKLAPDDAISRFTLLFGTESVWDAQEKSMISLGALKAGLAENYPLWMNSPNRAQIPAKNLIFDPTQTKGGAGYINMFEGLQIKPQKNGAKCDLILDLLLSLCGNNAEDFNWVLKWIAYPLKNLGAKMASAVIMHGDVEGTGKSLFWDGILKKIYGEYAVTVGQHQLESSYSDWMSRKLFGVFEEVLSREQKHNQVGAIKHMVTGETFRVEKKFVNGWEESNHINVVFLSNEVKPLHLGKHDRRFQVIWATTTIAPDLLTRTAEAAFSGGVEEFYDYLINEVDLTGFSPHTKPLQNEARQRIIEFGMLPWELFLQHWQDDELAYAPFICCTTLQLHRAFLIFCDKHKEKSMSATKFSLLIQSKIHKRRERIAGTYEKDSQAMVFLTVNEPLNNPVSRPVWIANQVNKFEAALKGDY